MRKRLFTLFLAICMICTLLPFGALAEEETPTSGTCGDDVTWKLEDGVLKISGTGEMDNYSYSGDDTPWYGLRGGIATVNINGKVTNIGNYAFFACGKLKSVKIGSDVKRIGDGAFMYCDSLESVTIPESVTSIGADAFCGCGGLKSVTIGKGVKSIDSYAFDDCDNLKDIYYKGSRAQWNKIDINEDNDLLANAKIHCDSGKTVTKNPFVDVKKADYYYDPILWAYSYDPQITKGVDDTHFEPNSYCTRGQIVTFLWRAKGCPSVKDVKNPFKDVKSNDYYYKAVLWAVSEEITKGIDDTHFAPNQTCTRAQSVTFMWRAENQPSVKGVKNPFKDVKSGDYYYEAVLWAVGENITNGMDKTHFAPNNTCTRGQIVTFLYRDMK